MAESGGPLSNGGPPVNDSLHTVLHTVDQLSWHVKDFQDHIDLQLLVPQLTKYKIITSAERYELQREATPPESRILTLITDILPRKGESILEQFKEALEDTLKEDGSSGHQTLLKKFFGLHSNSDLHSDSDDGVQQPTAYTISDESEEFSVLLMNFTKILENGNEKEVARKLRDTANYLCHLKRKNNSYLLKESVRNELCSKDLTFSKLFNCLDSSNPPVISYSDISMLHKIVDRVLKPNEACKKIIEPLKDLLNNYEKDSAISPTEVDPQVPTGSARIKARVTNAASGSPKLKNGVKKSLWHSFWMNFRGSGVGSVIFYWDFPEEHIVQVKESFENVCRNKTELHQLRITKVEVQLNQRPYQINVDMEITDPVLLAAAQKQPSVGDDIAPEQENFVLFLIKIDNLVGTGAELFLSTSRKELSRPYAQFEGSSFKDMTDTLIAGDQLHCYDISYIQQFLLSLLKWDTSQGGKHKELITAILKEAQDYEPVPTGSPLPSVQLRGRSHVATIVTNFFSVYNRHVSYDMMMTLKYALLQLLHLSLSSFQYVRWTKVNKGCQITWKTFPENLDRIENKLMGTDYPSTSALEVMDDFEIDYSYLTITFSCNVKNTQILLDGSALLYPDLDGKPVYLCMPYSKLFLNQVCTACSHACLVF